MANSAQASFLTSYIKGETTLGVLGTVAKGIAVLSALLIITELDVYRYGVYVLVFSLYYFISGFILRPMSEVIFSDIARFSSKGNISHAKKLFLEAFAIRMVLAAIACLMFLFGADIVENLYGEDVAGFFWPLAFVFLIDSFAGTIRILFEINLKFVLPALRQIVYRTIKFSILLGYFLFLSIGIGEAILAHVIASLVATIIFIPSFWKLYKPWHKVKAKSESVLYGVIKTHGKWALSTHFLSSATANLRPWLIKFFVNTEAVAIFSVAESIFGGIKSFIPEKTLTALIPRELQDKERRGLILMRGAKYLFLFAAVLGVIGLIVVPPIINFVFPKYNESIPLFLILLSALPILGLQGMATKFCIALRKQKFLFAISTIRIVAGLIFPIALLSLFGIFGLAFQRPVLALLIAFLLYRYLIKEDVSRSSLKLLFTFDKYDKLFLKRAYKMTIDYGKTLISKCLTFPKNP